MNSTIVKIGRAETSDIRISEDFSTVSNEHAYIELNNGVLTYVDHSSNGTLVNGVKYKGQSVTIHRGDEISLAGKCILSWDEILVHFPQLRRSTTLMDDEQTVATPAPRKTMSIDQMYGNEKVPDEDSLAVDQIPHADAQGRKTVAQNAPTVDGSRATIPHGGTSGVMSPPTSNEGKATSSEGKNATPSAWQRFSHWQAQQDPAIFWGSVGAIIFLVVYVIFLFNDIIYNII